MSWDDLRNLSPGMYSEAGKPSPCVGGSRLGDQLSQFVWLRGFPRYGIYSAKTGKVPTNWEKWIILATALKMDF